MIKDRCDAMMTNVCVETKGPIQSVSRAAMILRCFFNANELSLQEISTMVGLHKSTVSTLVTTLKNEQLLEQNSQNSKYRLGMMAFQLGANSNINISTIAHPYLLELNERFQETVNLAAALDDNIIYLNKIDGAHSMRTCTRIGQCLPFYCTANGKAIFANYPDASLNAIINGITFKKFTINTITNREQLYKELTEARENGFACDNEELENGLSCCAAPIFDYTNYPAAAISISGPSVRVNGAAKVQMIEAVKDVAGKITDKLAKSHYVASRHID